MSTRKNREKIVKHRLKFRTTITSPRYVNALRDILINIYGVEPDRYISGNLRTTCFNDFCIIHKPIQVGSIDTVIYSGSWIAIVVKNKVAPSIPLISEIFRENEIKGAIEVYEKGIKAFLYGNDVLVESIAVKHPPHDRIVAVIDHIDKEVVGFAEWDEKNKVYKNIYDIGIFIRHIS